MVGVGEDLGWWLKYWEWYINLMVFIVGNLDVEGC